MRRREFLVLLAAALARAGVSFGADAPGDMRIVRIVAIDLPTKRVKYVGKNARLDEHGDHSQERVVRLITESGVEGFGVCHADPKKLSVLFEMGQKPISMSTLGAGSAPLWDLLGKLADKPVYQLIDRRKTEVG